MGFAASCNTINIEPSPHEKHHAINTAYTPNVTPVLRSYLLAGNIWKEHGAQAKIPQYPLKEEKSSVFMVGQKTQHTGALMPDYYLGYASCSI